MTYTYIGNQAIYYTHIGDQAINHNNIGDQAMNIAYIGDQAILILQFIAAARSKRFRADYTPLNMNSSPVSWKLVEKTNPIIAKVDLGLCWVLVGDLTILDTVADVCVEATAFSLSSDLIYSLMVSWITSAKGTSWQKINQ